MKRVVLNLLLMAILPFSGNAQFLKIEYDGHDFPDSYKSRIVRTLTKEAEFYGPLGLQDTVTVKLKVFKDTDSANAFIRQYGPAAYGHFCSGMYIPEIKTAVVILTEDMDEAVQTLYHEISHSLYHKIIDYAPSSTLITAYGLNEGLACYFQFMKFRKAGSDYQQGNEYYISSVKTLIEINEFNLDEYLCMNHSSFEDKSRHDGNVSYHASYVIVATLFDKLGMEGMRELISMIINGTTYDAAVDAIYPGGKNGLASDIKAKIAVF